MRRPVILTVLAVAMLVPGFAIETLSPVQLYALECEHLRNPVGIGIQEPRLSWKLRSVRPGEIQTAWQVRAAASVKNLGAGRADLWDSGKIASDQSVLVPWAGKPLNSRSEVFWQVRVWDKDDQSSEWSDSATFELGLLTPASEWTARWITADLPRYDIEQAVLADSSWINAGSVADQAAAVRYALILPSDSTIHRATIDVAADGLITVYVNGHPTRQGSSSRTAPVHADISAQLTPGRNVIAVASAAVRKAIRSDADLPGRNAIAAHGVVEFQGGQRRDFDSDGSWKAAIAPGGDWFSPAIDDSAWAAASVLGPYRAHPSIYTDNTIGPGRYLRKSFATKGPVAKARLYATALGVYEAAINGRRVGDSVLDPGWTDYTKRVMVQTADVTRQLQPGTNVIGAVLGDGWYAGRLGWMGLAQYGIRPAFSAQLEITYEDGTADTIATDDSWKAGPGEIVGSDPQWGEVIDARRAIRNWAGPDLSNDTAWAPALIEQHTVALVPQLGPPVRKLLELPPQTISRHRDSWVVDFGQNMVGHVRLSARGPAGTTITVRHAEMLEPDGLLYIENLRPALSTDTFILRGADATEIFEPHFTFHGFRYVEVSGYPGTLAPADIRGIVIGSDAPPTGSFECSDPRLNRLLSNIEWSQRGNFLSVPTDCPQRDERMGWMGDAQVFAPTAARNADVAAFFAKWLVDVADGQGSRGDFANFSPRVAAPQPGWPVWGDAGVIIPWTMYSAYGDPAFLADHYAQMTCWVDYCLGRSDHLILTGGVGDHLAPRRTPVEVVDTAYFANSAHLLAKAAAILDRPDAAAKYDQLYHDVAAAFVQNFVSPDGVIKGDTQTAYLLALRFELLPDNLSIAAARRLAQNVEEAGHLTTGFVGVGLICPTLSQIGRSDLAWQLVLTDTYPSWLFSVKNGATTIWERWDGWTPEHGYQDPAMNSFNHYSLGSVGEWLYAGAAGIQLDESHPGYKRFLLKPQFTTRLSYAKATLDSPYGIIASGWRLDGEQMAYDVTIPPNSAAVLTLPVPPHEIRQSGEPIPAVRLSDPAAVFSLPAGTYHFSFPSQLVGRVE